MGTGKNVSVRALRILTYTILIKAVISAVKLVCSAADGLAARMIIPGWIGAGTVYVIAQMTGFIAIIAGVMCLVGISVLSKHFVYSYRVAVAVLIMESTALLMATLDIFLTINKVSEANIASGVIVLLSIVVARLLIGVALLLLMRGFGEVLRDAEDFKSATAHERLGSIYFCFNFVAVMLAGLAETKGSDAAFFSALAVSFFCIILELIIYRTISDSAFRIWRQRAFDDSEEWSLIP